MINFCDWEELVKNISYYSCFTSIAKKYKDAEREKVYDSKTLSEILERLNSIINNFKSCDKEIPESLLMEIDLIDKNSQLIGENFNLIQIIVVKMLLLETYKSLIAEKEKNVCQEQYLDEEFKKILNMYVDDNKNKIRGKKNE